MHAPSRSVLICDLNNFSRYPTIAVGYLARSLRNAGYGVRVFSPFAIGLAGVLREPTVPPWGLLDQRLRYWSALSPHPWVAWTRRQLNHHLGRPQLAREAGKALSGLRTLMAQRPDAVLVSTYLMYYDLVAEIGRLCAQADIPLLVGGPYFAQPEVQAEWLGLPGLTALSTGENELVAPTLVETMIGRDSLENFAGVRTAAGRRPARARPLQDLDRVPFPDYDDFPWQRYPSRIVPLATGRGCGWGRCTFCSDITSTAGRSFRSRSPENVLAELEFQSIRHAARQFVFADLKLNSNRHLWESLLVGIPRAVRDAHWIASVHIDRDGSHRLTDEHLAAARSAGMTRLTTGLESGSDRILESMRKGTSSAENSRVLRAAAAAGISVRTTVIAGYPGETAADLQLTTRFIEAHSTAIERISLNRYVLMTGTVAHRWLAKRPSAFPQLNNLEANHRQAAIAHLNEGMQSRTYRRALSELLAAVHAVNRRPLAPSARAFEGVM